MEGAFNNVIIESISAELVKINSQPKNSRWFSNMLGCKTINTQLCASTSRRKATRVTPQWGVISPLLWNIVLSYLLQKVEDQGCIVTAYANGLVLLVTGKFLPIYNQWSPEKRTEPISAMGRAERPWGKPRPRQAQKTELVLFTWKYKIPVADLVKKKCWRNKWIFW